MFKLFIFVLAVCSASAGLIGHGVAVAPVAVASAHVAESYQNNNLLSVHPVPVVATHSVGVAHAPVVAAAPVVAVSHGIGGGLGGGLGGGYGGHGYLH